MLAFFHWNTSAQFQLGPEGDSSYFVEMTQYFYIHESPSMHYPTMHSRRILGPFLAAKISSCTDLITGANPGKPFRYDYYGNDLSTNPPSDHLPTYHRIVGAWQLLDSAAFLAIVLGLFGVLQVLQDRQRTPHWQPIWLTLILCCSPTLGRLYFNWPMMNDLIGISLGILSLLSLLKGRAILSGILLGAGMLARENLALIYPCFIWIIFAWEQNSIRPSSRKTPLLTHFILAFAPFLLLCAFPVFRNLSPLHDATSGIRGTSVGATHDYLAEILFHLRRPFTAEYGILRQSVVYWHVCGPLLFLALRFYPWTRHQLKQDALLWVALLFVVGTAFYVDRYVVYAVFPLLLLSRHCLGTRISPFTAGCVSLFYLEAVLFRLKNGIGDNLQIEFTDVPSLKWSALLGAAALLLIILEPILRTRLVPLQTKAA